MVTPKLTAQRPELWAGIECTVNRVGDRSIRAVNPKVLLIQTEDLGKTLQTENIAVLGMAKNQVYKETRGVTVSGNAQTKRAARLPRLTAQYRARLAS